MIQLSSNKRILLLLVTPLLLAVPVFAQKNQRASQANEATTPSQSSATASAASLTKRDQNQKKHSLVMNGCLMIN